MRELIGGKILAQDEEDISSKERELCKEEMYGFV